MSEKFYTLRHLKPRRTKFGNSWEKSASACRSSSKCVIQYGSRKICLKKKQITARLPGVVMCL